MTTVYGISNCDTVRRARRALDDVGVDYRFHDLRKDGIERSKLSGWLKAVGESVLVNRRGTTWRRLPENRREIDDQAGWIDLLHEHPTLIKRPVIERDGSIRVGFAASDAASIIEWLKN